MTPGSVSNQSRKDFGFEIASMCNKDPNFTVRASIQYKPFNRDNAQETNNTSTLKKYHSLCVLHDL